MAQPPPPRPSGYFEKKGEVHELRQLLRGASADRDQQKKRDAIKKVIAYMTLGIDVSPLFSEMVMASATTDLVQKKMVYLYLVNYAESNSDLAILAINTLQKDCRDDDPMIRGLALRSLCSLSLANMVEYLQPAVQRALEDVNGYVRKTAVIGVVKLFYISPSVVTETDLLPMLKRLVSDSDAHVVSNTISALEEVLASEGGYHPTEEVITALLNRIMHFSEWGQCAILRLLTKYAVAGEAEMFDIMNILDGLLKQSSSAVVLSVTKIFVDLTSNRPDLQQDVLQRLKGPLLTLMAAASTELSYTVLVHIHALLTRGQRQIEASTLCAELRGSTKSHAPATLSPVGMSASITREEVAKHNKGDDAWIIVDGDVYDVTKFAGVHPGGTQILLEYAGKDATEDFFGLHRLEVLDKYQRLKKGRLADAGPAPKQAAERVTEVSKVPFAEPSYMQGFKSPYFDESHVKLRLAARKFFCGEAMEEALECEVKSTAPSKEMRKRMGDLGIIAMVQGPGEHLKIPSSLCGGVVKPEEFTYFHELVVQEERCRAMCPGYEDGLDGAVSIGLPVLLKYGSDWMKKEVVPAIVKGEQTVVLSITEAFAGSDVAGLRTTAVLDASGENYIVNGTKKWITGGMYADWFVTAVRTGKAGAGGISMMLIPRSDAVQTKVMKTKYSSSAGTAYVTYENCIVPKKYIIKGENKGFQIIMSNFNHERWMITVVCIARARIATEETFKWAMQRKVFGKPLIEQAVIREKLAQMFAGIETCTQMLWDITYNMCHVGTQGADIGARIALLKYQTTRMNHMVCDNAVQVFGGRGVTQGAMGRAVEVFSRMYKIPAVYGGSEEIMADLAVRTAIKAYPKTARL
ncbi:BETAA-AD [Symbiodinium natans]|uniref:BETAA-AD protein n=2 Tax=Symbiodinium TaxID=2949 RepID=A0A812LA30_9DINO|nr:BETAA-AD [Symbiodinium natans]